MKSYPVLLDKTYSLTFGTKALMTYERDSGTTVFELGSGSIGISTIVMLLHAGLSQLHPMTLDEVADVVDRTLENDDGQERLQVAFDVVSTAMSESGWMGERPTLAATENSSEPHSTQE